MIYRYRCHRKSRQLFAAPLDKCLGILNQLGFLQLIADQIVKLDMFHARDRLDIDLFCLLIHDNMECFVKAKLANTKFL